MTATAKWLRSLAVAMTIIALFGFTIFGSKSTVAQQDGTPTVAPTVSADDDDATDDDTSGGDASTGGTGSSGGTSSSSAGLPQTGSGAAQADSSVGRVGLLLGALAVVSIAGAAYAWRRGAPNA